MARKASPVRLVVALSVAAVLAVFLLYTSIAGGGNPSIAPGELGARSDTVQLAGEVVGPATGNPHGEGLRFTLRDIDPESDGAVAVLYTGSVPDLFKVGRHVVVKGQLEGDTFVAEPGSMMTKCPSKFAPKRDDAP